MKKTLFLLAVLLGACGAETPYVKAGPTGGGGGLVPPGASILPPIYTSVKCSKTVALADATGALHDFQITYKLLKLASGEALTRCTVRGPFPGYTAQGSDFDTQTCLVGQPNTLTGWTVDQGDWTMTPDGATFHPERLYSSPPDAVFAFDDCTIT